MGTGVSNFKAQCWFRLRETILPSPKLQIPVELRKSIDLWDFIIMDTRPLMIVNKEVALINRFDATISESVLFKNQAFIRFAAALDVVIRWRPSEAPTSSYPFQYVQTETSKYKMITRDSSPPTNPMLDWTRRSISTWVPEHYRDLLGVNWKHTPLGEMGSWSGSLVHPYQMALFWSKDYVTIYNGSYADVVRNRHPQLLGQELAKGWPEAYEKIHEYLDNCRRGLSIIRSGDTPPVDRTDKDEECYFDWTLTPILEKAGNVGGVLWQQYEVKLSSGLTCYGREILIDWYRNSSCSSESAARDVENTEGCHRKCTEYHRLLASCSGALYEIPRNSENEAILIGSRGIPEEHSFPRVLVLAEFDGHFSEEIREARRTGSKVKKEGLQAVECFRNVAHRGFRAPCSTAVVIPILSRGDIIRTEAFIVLGINPKRRLDDDYDIWLDQIQDNISEYLAGVRSAEQVVQEAMREQLADVEKRRASELSARLKEVKDQLRKKELRFTNMASAIPIGLIEMNSNGAAVFTNDAWHEIMGIPRDRDEKTWIDVIHQDDRDWWSKRLHDAARCGVHLPIEYRLVDTTEGYYNDQKIKWVVSEVLPVYDDAGVLHGFYSTVADITPLKLAEKEQKERADEALERTKQQERFIDIICHELRNPLSAILQHSELVLDVLDGYDNSNHENPLDFDSITDSANTIILCTSHQRRIIDDILITSKLDSGLVKVEPVDFSPGKYLETAVSMYKAEAQSKGIEMTFIVEPAYTNLDIQWLKGDPSRVMQILLNLITNAIKFTIRKDERRIEIRLGASLEEPASYGRVVFTKDGSSDISSFSGSQWGYGEVVYLIITVTDTGIGIPDEGQKNLFGRFQQAPKTESKYGGSGSYFLADSLGLYICKNMTKLLGGSIGVISTKDKGSQFSFYVTTRRGNKSTMEEQPELQWLARHAGKTASSTPSKTTLNQKDQPPVMPARRNSAVSGFKMLVVEDNVINQKVMKRQLEARGCTVYTANNGLEAVEFIQQSSLNPNAGSGAKEIEICFMDCEMPIMNGMAASQQIRQMQVSGDLSRHLPILGVSANVRGPQVQAMKDAGMDDVVSKPFSINELVRSAAALVNSQSVQDWSIESAVNLQNVESVGVVIGGEGSRKGSVTSYSAVRT
ncbi:hypothetical protein K440DRAFT_665193 [Wilcoxina mikolae CBS 423.85]|nr:hypothetical protein K440DRAFT_665193 [Wilcoxina mikolae CBS 423.85]